MLDAGSVFATLGGKFSPAGFVAFDGAMKKSAASAAAAEKQMATSAQRSSAAMSLMGSNAGKASTASRAGFLAIGAAAAIGLGKSVQAAMSFEQQMSSLQAYTKAGTKDMKLMSAAARELGTKTGVGATQAAKGMTELAKGGLTAKQATEALVGTINLAQAGDMDLAEASNAVVQSMSTFGLKAKDATMIVDGLASAANKTTMDVSDFTQAFAQGGLAASNAGMSFDETLNVMGVMANRFKSGSDMGTSLKTTLTALARPTNKAKDEMHRLNIDLFDSHGKFRKASEVTKQLGDRFAEMTPKQRTASAAIIAGTDGMRTLIALANAPKGKGGNFRDVGAGADVAATKMDNLAGSWKRLKANMENVGITVGNEVIPKLRDASEAASQFLQDMQEEKPGSAGGAFKQLTDFAREGSGMSWDFLKEGARATQYLLDAIGNYHPKDVTITAKVADEASPVLARLKDAKFAPKVQKILADDSSPREKYNALRALKIPDIVARLILQEKGVDAAIAALNRVPKTVPVTARLRDEASQILNNIINKPLKDKVAKIIADDSSVKEKVSALMALGISGPTAHFLANTVSVVDAANQLRGQSITVPVQYVPQVMRPNLPGGLPTPGDKSAGGRRAAGRGPGAHESALVGEGAGPEWAGNERDGWRLITGPTFMGLGPDDYVIPTEQRYRGRALDLLASAFGIPAFAKGKKPTKKERRAQQDRRITSAETQAGTAGTQMDTAQELQRQTAFEKAKARKIKLLELERTRLKGALRGAKGARKTDLRAKLANVENDLARTRKSSYTAPEAPDSVDTTKGTPLDTNMQRMLDGYDAKVALAELNDDPLDPATLKDNIGPLTEKAGFLQRALAAAQADPRFGGPSVVASLARDLKSTRDQITDLSKAPSLTADQQASADQQYQRGLAAGQTSFIDRLTAATVQGAAPSLVFQTYVPPSPSEARRLADHVVSGVDFQGGRPASSQRIGV